MGAGTGSMLHSPYCGIHNDADGTTASVSGMTALLEHCGVRDGKANGAPMLYKSHGVNVQAGYALGAPFLIASRAAGYEILASFDPFSTTPGDAGQESAVLAWVDSIIARWQAINPIFLLFNHSAETWTGTDAEFFTLEGKCLKKLQDAGLRWGAVDDKGLSWLCQNVQARIEAWEAEGVVRSNCLLLGAHVYVVSGWVPVHTLLAQDSLLRCTPPITIPIWHTECAWDFVHANADPPENTRAGRPDMFLRPATDWTKWMFRWSRAKGIPLCYFDAPMLKESNGVTLSSLGVLYTEDQQQQPGYAAPQPADVPPYNVAAASTRAYSIRLSNGGTVAEANAAAARVNRGIVFER